MREDEMSKPEDKKNANEELEEALELESDVEVGSADTDDGAEASLEIDTVESLQAKLEQALTDANKFKDVALRAEAEMQNLRRRASIDLENAHKYGVEKFIQSMLPVADGLEKAVESAEKAANDEASKAISDGVGICHKMMVDVLKKESVEVVDPAGEPFDPNLHQAMSMVENPDVEPNSVVAVVQKGYTLKGRLLRPAMVMVSKPSPNNTTKIDETA
jgi:molecular chaperone GrpE